MDGAVVESEVEDGVHHAGHALTAAGPDGDEQGVVRVAELLADQALDLFDALVDLLRRLGGTFFCL